MYEKYCLGQETEEFIKLITCAVSILSGLAVIILCLIPRLLEKTTKQIIFFLALNSITRDSLEILGVYSHGFLCIIVAYLKNIFLISSVFWSGFIAKTINDVVTNRGDYQPKYFLFTLIFSYILMPLILLIPFITNSYDSEFCTGLKLDFIGLIWRYSIVYIPCFIVIFITLVFYVKMYRFIKSRGEVDLSGILIERGLLYSIFFIVIFIILVVVRFVEYNNQSKESSCFRYAGALLIYFQGILVLIITLFRNDIKSRLSRQQPNRSESNESYLNFLIN